MLTEIANYLGPHGVLGLVLANELAWLLLNRYARRRAFAEGFQLAARRSADMARNGYDNPAHPIHKLYL